MRQSYMSSATTQHEHKLCTHVSPHIYQYILSHTNLHTSVHTLSPTLAHIRNTVGKDIPSTSHSKCSQINMYTIAASCCLSIYTSNHESTRVQSGSGLHVHITTAHVSYGMLAYRWYFVAVSGKITLAMRGRRHWQLRSKITAPLHRSGAHRYCKWDVTWLHGTCMMCWENIKSMW